MRISNELAILGLLGIVTLPGFSDDATFNLMTRRAADPSASAEVRQKAIADLRKSGEIKRAVAELQKIMEMDSHVLQEALENKSVDKHAEARVLAAYAIWKLEGRGETVMPTLRKLLKLASRSGADPRMAETLVKTLGEMGTAARETIPDLLLFSFRSQHDHRPAAPPGYLEALARIEPDRSGLLIRSFANVEEIAMSVRKIESATHVFYTADKARDQLSTYLAEMGVSVIPAVTKALSDKNSEVRRGAAMTLSRLGAKAGVSAGDLRKTLTDNAPTVRIAAAEALFKVTNQANDSIPVLTAALLHEDSRIRGLTCQALASFKDQASPAIPHLIRGLGVANEQSPRTCVDYPLAMIGLPAVEPLVKALDDANPKVRLHALRALSYIRLEGNHRWELPLGRAAVRMSQFLKDDEFSFRSGAAVALTHFGKFSAPAWKEILAAGQQGKIPFHEFCNAAMAIGPVAKDAGPWLLTVMRKSEAFWSFDLACTTIAKVAPDQADEAAAFLVSRLADRKVRRAAFHGLEKLGPLAKSAIPELKRILTSGPPDTNWEDSHYRALYVLFHTGKEAKAAEAEVVDVLLKEPRLGMVAAKVLANVMLSTASRQKLETAAKSSDERLARAAQAALKSEKQSDK